MKVKRKKCEETKMNFKLRHAYMCMFEYYYLGHSTAGGVITVRVSRMYF